VYDEIIGRLQVSCVCPNHSMHVLTKRIRKRWELTLADKSSLSELKAAVEDSSGESPCIVGLRSVCWKVNDPPCSIVSARQAWTNLIQYRHSCCSRTLTDQHGLKNFQTRGAHTPLFANISSMILNTQMTLNRRETH